MQLPTKSITESLLHWTSLTTSCLLFASIGSGQDLKFKLELFDRGIAQFQSLDKPIYVDIENAMEAAFAIAPERLPDELVEKLQISNSEAFRSSVNAAPYINDLERILCFLPDKNVSQLDVDPIARLAFIMGSRKEDLSLLLKACEEFLTKSSIEDDYLLYLDWADRKDLSETVIRQKRTEYLQFIYYLGRFADEETLESAEFFQRGISTPQLKKYIRAVWLTRVGIKVLNGTELLKEIDSFKSKELACRVLIESLKRYDPAQLKSMVGDMLISHLIQLYFDAQSEKKTSVFIVDQIKDCFPEIDSVQTSFGESMPGQVISLIKTSQSIQTELEILEQIKIINEKDQIAPKLWKRWGEALVDSSLRSGNLVDAKKIATHFSMTIPTRAIFDMAVQHGDVALAKKTVDSLGRFDRRSNSIVASLLAQAGRNKEAEFYLNQLEGDFNRNLESQSNDKKAKFIVNQVLVSGWSMRGLKIPQLPLEKLFLKSFGPLVSSSDINDVLARSIDSFTPPTPASKIVLLKMMKMLPESKQIATLHEVTQLDEKIRGAAKADLTKLRKEAIKLIKRPIAGNKDAYVSRLSFAFAMAGDTDGVNQMIKQIKSAEFRTWALFQCAKAFPPRNQSISQHEYIRRLPGGLF